LTEASSTAHRIEYDWGRVIRRWPYALLVCVFWVLGAHGLSWFPVTKPCNGGWWDGVEFVAEFLGAGILIEAFEWV